MLSVWFWCASTHQSGAACPVIIQSWRIKVKFIHRKIVHWILISNTNIWIEYQKSNRKTHWPNVTIYAIARLALCWNRFRIEIVCAMNNYSFVVVAECGSHCLSAAATTTAVVVVAVECGALYYRKSTILCNRTTFFFLSFSLVFRLDRNIHLDGVFSGYVRDWHNLARRNILFCFSLHAIWRKCDVFWPMAHVWSEQCDKTQSWIFPILQRRQ